MSNVYAAIDLCMKSGRSIGFNADYTAFVDMYAHAMWLNHINANENWVGFKDYLINLNEIEAVWVHGHTDFSRDVLECYEKYRTGKSDE